MNFKRVFRTLTIVSFASIAISTIPSKSIAIQTETNAHVSTSKQSNIEPGKNDFSKVIQRVENLFEVYETNSIEPVVKHQFVLDVARVFYNLTRQTAPAGLNQQVAAMTTDAEFQKWLAVHWEKSGLQSHTETSLADDPQGLISDKIAALLVRKLAPGAWYETAKSRRVAKQLAENQYVGIGIRVRWVEDKAMIDEPFPGGAAYLAGSRKGDFIMEVDGESMMGLNLAKIIDVLRGQEGSKVSVVVQNQDESDPRQLDMVRTVIPIPSVQGVKQNDDGSWQFMDAQRNDQAKRAYLRISSIVGSTSAELKEAAQKIIAKDAQGVVLDLRQLQHGDLHQVNLIADVLTDGADFGILYPASGSSRSLQTNPGSDFDGLPVAVLTPEHKNISGPILALLASMKKRPNTEMIGKETVSDTSCRSSFDLPQNDGAIAGLAYARLLPPGIENMTSQHTDLSGQTTQTENGYVRFAPDVVTTEGVDPLLECSKWLDKISQTGK